MKFKLQITMIRELLLVRVLLIDYGIIDIHIDHDVY